MEKILSKRRGLLALSPLVVFLCVYLVSSVIAQDFYHIPISSAFLIASIYALIISKGKTLEERISVFSEGAGNKNVLLMKPQTYMNNSGEAVSAAARFYKVPAEKIIVLFDDCAIPVAALRIRRKGSAGGHNGIKSIIEHLGTQDFPRVKIGVGEKPHPEYDLADWVLSNFSQSEFKSVCDRFDDVFGAVEQIVSGNIDKAMNLYSK